MMAPDTLSISRGESAETASGRIAGSERAGIRAFLGIPYGGPTGGRNRFRPPSAVEPWAGVRDCLAASGHAPPDPGRAARRPELETLLGPTDMTAETEDCLTLNLWTPGLDDARRPVMVWLHGGAFSFGSANRAISEGANLARRGDVVVVAVNHRLNILGFLDLADAGGSDYAGSGNAGMLDLVAALEWVRAHAHRFGGDAGNVTIFGESGGGAKVGTLCAMPAARGLFHRAIVQSGAVVRLRTRERAAALTDAVMRELGLGEEGVGGLATLPVARLMAAIAPAQRALGRTRWPLLDRYDFGPVVDGGDVACQPCDPEFPALADEIPLLIGDMTQEAAFFLADDDEIWNATLSEAGLARRLEAVAGDAGAQAQSLYRARAPAANPAERAIAALTDSNFRVRSLIVAERKARRRRAPVYMYSFACGTPVFGGRLGAHHVLDVPFVFDTLAAAPTSAAIAGADALAALVSATWAEFARTGVPANPDLPPWPAYDETGRATMVLDHACRVVADPDREARLLWQRVACA
jgi:para-nitrobenzyl esterase